MPKGRAANTTATRSGASSTPCHVLSPLLQLLFTFPDLALRLAVGGHASTQTCLVVPSCTLSRASRTSGTVSSAATHDCFVSLCLVWTLFSRGASLCQGLCDSSGVSLLFSQSYRCLRCFKTMLSCASASFIFGCFSCTFWIIGTCLCMISGICLFPELCLMNRRDR